MNDQTRKYAVTGILLFAAVLFVGGVGDVITGQAVAGAQEIDIALGETVQVLGEDVTLLKFSGGSSEEFYVATEQEFYTIVLEVSGMKRKIKMGDKEQINNLMIKFESVEYSRTPQMKVHLKLYKAVGGSPDSGLINFPYPFIKNGKYDSCVVVSDTYSQDEWTAAKMIAESMQQHRKAPPVVIPENRISDRLCGSNKILVGKPCELKLIAEHFGDDSCEIKDLANGEGFIEYKSKTGRPITADLIVTGNSNKDILKAATVVKHQLDFYVVETNKAVVYGDLINDYSLHIRELGTVSPIYRGGGVKQVRY